MVDGFGNRMMATVSSTPPGTVTSYRSHTPTYERTRQTSISTTTSSLRDPFYVTTKSGSSHDSSPTPTGDEKERPVSIALTDSSITTVTGKATFVIAERVEILGHALVTKKSNQDFTRERFMSMDKDLPPPPPPPPPSSPSPPVSPSVARVVEMEQGIGYVGESKGKERRIERRRTNSTTQSETSLVSGEPLSHGHSSSTSAEVEGKDGKISNEINDSNLNEISNTSRSVSRVDSSESQSNVPDFSSVPITHQITTPYQPSHSHFRSMSSNDLYLVPETDGSLPTERDLRRKAFSDSGHDAPNNYNNNIQGGWTYTSFMAQTPSRKPAMSRRSMDVTEKRKAVSDLGHSSGTSVRWMDNEKRDVTSTVTTFTSNCPPPKPPRRSLPQPQSQSRETLDFGSGEQRSANGTNGQEINEVSRCVSHDSSWSVVNSKSIGLENNVGLENNGGGGGSKLFGIFGRRKSKNSITSSKKGEGLVTDDEDETLLEGGGGGGGFGRRITKKLTKRKRPPKSNARIVTRYGSSSEWLVASGGKRMEPQDRPKPTVKITPDDKVETTVQRSNSKEVSRHFFVAREPIIQEQDFSLDSSEPTLKQEERDSRKSLSSDQPPISSSLNVTRKTSKLVRKSSKVNSKYIPHTFTPPAIDHVENLDNAQFDVPVSPPQISTAGPSKRSHSLDQPIPHMSMNMNHSSTDVYYHHNSDQGQSLSSLPSQTNVIYPELSTSMTNLNSGYYPVAIPQASNEIVFNNQNPPVSHFLYQDPYPATAYPGNAIGVSRPTSLANSRQSSSISLAYTYPPRPISSPAPSQRPTMNTSSSSSLTTSPWNKDAYYATPADGSTIPKLQQPQQQRMGFMSASTSSSHLNVRPSQIERSVSQLSMYSTNSKTTEFQAIGQFETTAEAQRILEMMDPDSEIIVLTRPKGSGSNFIRPLSTNGQRYPSSSGVPGVAVSGVGVQRTLSTQFEGGSGSEGETQDLDLSTKKRTARIPNKLRKRSSSGSRRYTMTPEPPQSPLHLGFGSPDYYPNENLRPRSALGVEKKIEEKREGKKNNGVIRSRRQSGGNILRRGSDKDVNGSKDEIPYVSSLVLSRPPVSRRTSAI